jgi:hypothetical protein
LIPEAATRSAIVGIIRVFERASMARPQGGGVVAVAVAVDGALVIIRLILRL